MNNSFDSVDRLMDLGMSMAVAQQMMQTMNHAINNMPVAGAQNQMLKPAPKQYYVVVDGAQAGPFQEDELIQLITGGKVNSDTLMWSAGMKGWDKAVNLPEINKLLLLNAPPAPTSTAVAKP